MEQERTIEFDPSKVGGGTEAPKTIPNGTYELAVASGLLRDSKSGNGRHVQIRFKVASGPDRGFPLYCHFNVEHKNADTQRIGQSEFKQFLAALGITSKIKLDKAFFDSIAGRTLWAEVETESWGGSASSKPVEFRPTRDKASPTADDIPF